MDGRFERLLNAVFTLAAVMTAVVVVRREFRDNERQGSAATGLDGPPKFVSEWKAIVAQGERVFGPPGTLVLPSWNSGISSAHFARGSMRNEFRN